MITLEKFTKHVADDAVVVSCTADIDGETQKIAFEIRCDEELKNVIEVKPIAFVTALLIPAMERGEDIYVDDVLDADQVHRINKYIVSMLSEKNRTLTSITVTSKSQKAFAPPKPGTRGALTGMSCGVDSLRTLMVYGPDGQDVPDHYRLKYFGVYDVGAFYNSAQQFPRALEKAKQVADSNGCKVFGVSSDFGKFYETSFPLSCTMRHVACTMCLTDFVDVYLVSSAYPWPVVGIQANAPTAMEALDPILLPMLSTNQLEMFSACANDRREDKVKSLLLHSPYLNQIDVCTRPTDKRDYNINCGTCQKCADFVLLAEYMGLKDKIAPYFDLVSFERRKFRIFQRIFTSQTIFLRQYPGLARDEVKERAVPSPFGSIFVGILIGKLVLLADAFRAKRH